MMRKLKVGWEAAIKEDVRWGLYGDKAKNN